MAKYLEPVTDPVAGIDVHGKRLTVTILKTGDDGESTHETREFSAFKKGIRELADWLGENEVAIVVMESTGVYWRSPYDSLRNRGVHRVVVNAMAVKNAPGRKTDTDDSLWLAVLVRAALLRPSLIPSDEIVGFRNLARFRQKMVDTNSSMRNGIHKILSDCGFRLEMIMTDISGKTGSVVIDGLIDGLSPREILLKVTSTVGYGLKATKEDFPLALEGNLTEESYFVLKELRLMSGVREAEIAKTEREPLSRLRLKHGPVLRLLETIPGVSETAAAILWVELGGDIDAFKSAGSMAKWAGMCPGDNESAGKRRSGRTRPGNKYLRRILCEVAQAAVKTRCYYMEKYKSLCMRRGRKRSIIAIGHKILVAIYHMVKKNVPYEDKSVNFEELMVKKCSKMDSQANRIPVH
jgi:transposase